MARQTFPDNTIFANSAPEITQPETSRWATGYESGTGKTPPSAGVHNYEFNRGDQMLQHVEQNGVPVWDARTIYALRGWSLGSDGMLYRSKLTGNTANNPVGGDGTYWSSLTEIVNSSLPAASTTQSGIVELATNAEAATPTITDRAVTPSALLNGVLGLGMRTNNGYIEVPCVIDGVKRNMLVQWGGVTNPTDGQGVFFAKQFPTTVLQVVSGLDQDGTSINSNDRASVKDIGAIQFKASVSRASAGNMVLRYIAIGY